MPHNKVIPGSLQPHLAHQSMYHLKETWVVQPLIIEQVICSLYFVVNSKTKKQVIYLLLHRTPVSMIKHLLQITVNIFNDDTNL